MKRVLLSLIVALLIPGVLSAQATMGVYFTYTPGLMTYDPIAFNYFDAYLYLHNANQYITGIEYQLLTPDDPGHVHFTISAVDYPPNQVLAQGMPFSGHSVVYWPPLDGWNPGYNLMVKYTCITFEPCYGEGGLLANYQLVVGPHPDSGELRGTYYPNNEFFPITGLTSILCPEPDAVKVESWGAIKSMYR